MIELLGIGEPADAVMGEDEVVAGAHLPWVTVLGWSKWSLMTLNTTLSDGRVKTAITMPAVALGDLEAGAGRARDGA